MNFSRLNLNHLICFLLITSVDVSGKNSEIPYEPNWFLIGLELGYQTKDEVTDPEVENEGTEAGIKILYSRYGDNWLVDFGVGYRNDHMEKNEVVVATKAFFGELGIRYRLSQSWNFGPELQVLSGQDVSFSDVGTNSDDKDQALFLGIRLMHDAFDEDQEDVLRLGIQALTDMDINERKVTYVQFVAEFGWPFGNKEEPKPQPEPEPEPVVEEVVKSPEPEEPKLKLNLKNAGVQFDTAMSTLKGRSKEIIENLASILIEYDTEWDFVTIEGHTDIRGTREVNMELSQARAQTIVSVFIEKGINREKMSAQGFGPDKPLDDRRIQEAYQVNRRVELHLRGENPSQEFVSRLETLLGTSNEE